MLLSRVFGYYKMSSLLWKPSKCILNSIVIPKRKVSSMKFVDRMRLQQKLKASEQLSAAQYENGIYLIYVRKDGLILMSNDTVNLVHADFKVLSKLCPDLQSQAVFLNVDESGRCRLAVEFASLQEPQLEVLHHQFQGRFVQLRQSLFLLPAHQSALVSLGRSMLQWRRKRNFCAECGGALIAKAGWSHKMCGSCATPSYPQTSPVGIALVENDDHSQALLVRQPRHPPGMYSCLAGFVDPGESLEQNIVREVAEEVGLEVSAVRYLQSQHWAYPAGRLMLGCVATALPGEVDIDPEELEAAAWFSPAVLRAALCQSLSRKTPNEKEIWLPPVGALAHSLINWWLKQYHPE